MVRRLLGVLTREIRGLHEAAYLLAFFSFLSQALALVRDRTFAHLFGAGPVLDSYFAAFRIPDLIFAFLTLFVSSFALIPLLSGREKHEQGALVGNVLLVFGVVSLVVSGILWFAIPYIVPKMFIGFSPAMIDNTILLSRIMLIQPIFLGLSSIAASVVQVMRQFLIYALAPLLYNIGIIVGAFFFYPTYGIQGLAWGVVLGALLHLLAQSIPLVSARKTLSVSIATLRASIIDVALPSMPRALALSAHQVLFLVFTAVASLTAVGTVSALSLGFNLQSVPLTIIGVSYAAALFPALAGFFAKGDHISFANEVWATVRHIVFWTLPAVALIIVLRAQIVRTVLGSGEFSWSDTRLTAAILALFAVSLISQAVILVFSRAYYAAQATWVPVVVNVGSAIGAALLAYFGVIWIRGAEISKFFLEDLFRVTDIPGTAVLMIPFAYSFAMVIGSLLFAYLFARRFGFDFRTLRTVGASFAASILAAFAAYGALQALAPLLPTETFLGIFTQGALSGLAGICVWIGVLALMKSQELFEILDVVLQKLKRRAV